MKDNTRESPLDKYTPRSIPNSQRSFTSINNSQDKSPKSSENPKHNEAVFSQYYVQGSFKSDLVDGLSPLKKKLSKSQSTSGIKSGAMSLTLKRQNLPNNEGLTEPKTVLLKSSGKLLSEDLTSFSRKVSVQRGSIREIRSGNSILGNHEIEDVKELDSWKFEMKKKKLLKTDVRYTDITKQSGRSQDATNVVFPNINTYVINKILKDDHGDKIINETGQISTRDKPKANEPEENEEKEDLRVAPTKSLEVRMRENKEEITNNLVIKRVQRSFKDQNIERMSPDNLKSHIQAIAKETMGNFRSLDGKYPKSKIESCLRIVTDSKRLKAGNESPEPSNLPTIKGMFQEKNNGDKEYVMNYRDIESAFRKDLEKMTEMADSYVWKTTQLNGQTKRLENEIKRYEEQIAQLTERSTEAGSPPKSLSPGLKKRFNFDGKSDRNNVYDFQRYRLEQNKVKVELQQKLEEATKAHFDKERELVNADQALKEFKENKSKLKIQLRDLYLRILKDEAYLLKSNSSLNYAWVIQSLWDMNQKIKSEDFPSFLGEEEMIFILEYAHAQDALLKFCKEKNLFNIPVDSENPKQSSIRDMLGLVQNIVTPIRQDSMSPTKTKTYESILSEFRNKMKKMKEENLKAKDVHGLFYANSKATPRLKYGEASQRFSPVAENRSNQDIAFRLDSRENPNTNRLKINFSNASDDSGDKKVVRKLLNELENMKLEESDKMIKRYWTRNLESKDKESLLKAFIFLFGSHEGRTFYNNLFKDQQQHQQRLRANNPNSSKPASVTFMLADKSIYGFKPSNLSESESYSPAESPLLKSKGLLRSNSNTSNRTMSPQPSPLLKHNPHSNSLSPVKIKLSSTRQTPFS